MAEADGIVMCDPIFRDGRVGLFHTIMDRFGPRMDTGNNVIATKIARGLAAEGKPSKEPDPRVICPGKPVSYIAIGGSDWGTHAQSDHAIQSADARGGSSTTSGCPGASVPSWTTRSWHARTRSA